jgi:hypothetical protein
MHAHTTAIERAFELARSGRFGSVQGIRIRLKQEGYNPDQIEGPMLVDQIRSLMQPGRTARFNGKRLR